MAIERPSAVKLRGNPLTLVGPEIKVGDMAPDFQSQEGLGQVVGLKNFDGKIKVFNVVVSLDTPVCDVQTKKFSQEAANLPEDVEIVTVSMDLPFAQKRYCGTAGIDNVRSVSDYQYASFGEAYGVLIKENRLLARSIIVVDKNDVVQHVEYVEDISQEPNYDAVLNAVKSLL